MRFTRNGPFFVIVILVAALSMGGWGIGFAQQVDHSQIPSQSAHRSTPITAHTALYVVTKTKPGEVHAVELDLLTNIKTFGFNSDRRLNNGLGGLWVNWRYGSRPLQTDINGTGQTDEVSGTFLRHDDLTDVRYLHNLWSYKQQNPDDHQFDNEINRFTKIVRQEFANAQNERGWLYNVFTDMYHLSHDHFYQDAALNLVQSYARAFDGKSGMIYKINDRHPHGTYRIDLAIEQACALIQAGTQFHSLSWVQKGTSMLQFVYTHAYIAQYHTFANQMENVLNPNGSVNEHEDFFLGITKNYIVHGNHMQMGGISQAIVALLDTYQVTGLDKFLNKATALLDQLVGADNGLRMWDKINGGYYFSANFAGHTITEPGVLTVDQSRKEAGRQAIMLQAFHLANKVTNNRYKDMENQMLDIAVHHIYDARTHGVHYVVRDNWTPTTFNGGNLDDIDTTEAMGAELESLFSSSH